MSRKRKVDASEGARKRHRPTADAELFRRICTTCLFRPPIKQWHIDKSIAATRAPSVRPLVRGRIVNDHAESDSSSVRVQDVHTRSQGPNVKLLIAAPTTISSPRHVSAVTEVSKIQHARLEKSGGTSKTQISVCKPSQKRPAVRKQHTSDTLPVPKSRHLNTASTHVIKRGKTNNVLGRTSATKVTSIPSSFNNPDRQKTHLLLKQFLEHDDDTDSESGADDSDDEVTSQSLVPSTSMRPSKEGYLIASRPSTRAEYDDIASIAESQKTPDPSVVPTRNPTDIVEHADMSCLRSSVDSASYEDLSIDRISTSRSSSELAPSTPGAFPAPLSKDDEFIREELQDCTTTCTDPETPSNISDHERVPNEPTFVSSGDSFSEASLRTDCSGHNTAMEVTTGSNASDGNVSAEAVYSGLETLVDVHLPLQAAIAPAQASHSEVPLPTDTNAGPAFVLQECVIGVPDSQDDGEQSIASSPISIAIAPNGDLILEGNFIRSMASSTIKGGLLDEQSEVCTPAPRTRQHEGEDIGGLGVCVQSVASSKGTCAGRSATRKRRTISDIRVHALLEPCHDQNEDPRRRSGYRYPARILQDREVSEASVGDHSTALHTIGTSPDAHKTSSVTTSESTSVDVQCENVRPNDHTTSPLAKKNTPGSATCRSGRKTPATIPKAQHVNIAEQMTDDAHVSKDASDLPCTSIHQRSACSRDEISGADSSRTGKVSDNSSSPSTDHASWSAVCPSLDHDQMSAATSGQEEDIYGLVDALARNMFENGYSLSSSKPACLMSDPAMSSAETLLSMSQDRAFEFNFAPFAFDNDQICMHTAICGASLDGDLSVADNLPLSENLGNGRRSRAASVTSSSSLSEISDSAMAMLATEIQTYEPAKAPEELTRTKRKMTGNTSKHFSPVKRRQMTRASGTPQKLERTSPEADVTHVVQSSDVRMDQSTLEEEQGPYQIARNITIPAAQRSIRTLRSSTGKVSEHFHPERKIDTSLIDRVDLYNTTASSRKISAGVSRCPVPSIREARFGIVQEKLWQEPFWLLIAVIFLNQTTGRAAVPVMWKLKARYPEVEDVANADQAEIFKMIQHLGFGDQRSRKFIQLANVWLTDPPTTACRHRTLHYPSKGDGKEFKKDEIIDVDSELTAGALEIGHLPGCGRYAWDSWRIFCRDVLRGVAKDYNGLDAQQESFQPEWQRVLPQDKELRACLRWMWLREGYIWDPLTGEKRPATEEEMEKAIEGEIEIDDPKERKFAAQAATILSAETEHSDELKHEEDAGLDEERSDSDADSSLSAPPSEWSEETD